MSKLEKALIILQSGERGELRDIRVEGEIIGTGVSPLAALLVTLLYLALMLSLPVSALSRLIWFAVYPIVGAPLCGISYGTLLKRSLYVVPLILLIGIFNPIFDREVAFYIGKTPVSEGWVSFISVTLRGLLAAQALLLLISCYGFRGLCRGLERIGLPRFMSTQLMFVYRYLTVLLSEALDMRRAREARGYGKSGLPLRMWGRFTGELFLRTVARSERIHRAMISRGFTGVMPHYGEESKSFGKGSAVWIIGWSLVLVFLRIYDITPFFTFIR